MHLAKEWLRVCLVLPALVAGVLGCADTESLAGPAPRRGDTPPPPTSTQVVNIPGGIWVAGYYVGYQANLYPPEAVDFDSLTHLIVGRVVPQSDGSLNQTLDIDPVKGPELARRLSSLAHAHGKKAMLMIGGAGVHAAWVEATSPAKLSLFVANLLKLMTDLGYDGLDLDWEPLESGDSAQCLQLVKALRAAKANILLSVPVGWVNLNSKQVSSIYIDLARYVDKLNIMSYSMADNWGGGWHSWHSSALTGGGSHTPTSVEGSVDAYAKAGIDRRQIGVGAGFYGSCWSAPVTAPGQDPGGGKIIASDNDMSYANLVAGYISPANQRWDAAAQVPYLSNPAGIGAKRCTFVSYEDERSLAAKARYVVNQRLGGMIIWTINQGYVPGAYERNPLLKAIQRGLTGG